MTSGARCREGYLQFRFQFSENLPAPSNRCSCTNRKTSLCKSKYCGFNHLIQSIYKLGLLFSANCEAVVLSYFPRQEGQLKQSFLPPRLPHSSASESSAAVCVLLTGDWCSHTGKQTREKTYKKHKRVFLFSSSSVQQSDSLCTCTNIYANTA